MCQGYMLDTNVFNRLADGALTLKALENRQIFVTHVQRDELGRTRDVARRDRLLRTMLEVGSTSLPTPTSVWDDTKWDEGCWSAEDSVYERLLQRIQELDSANGKSPREPLNHSRDARIAEAALKARLVLVTDDKNLAQAMREGGGTAVTSADLLKLNDRLLD